MTDSNLRLLLSDMHLAATEAVSFVEGLTEEEFLQHAMAKRATTMCIHSIGEAAARLAEKHPDFVSAYPELSVTEMRGMRNRISHGYGSVNFYTVWQTVRYDLPVLIRQIDAIMVAR